MDPAVVDRYAAAVGEAVARSGPLGFRAVRMLVSPISVMLALEPTDDQPSRLAATLAELLGDDGWYEHDRVRDIWYVNLVHFGGPVARPGDLVGAVDRCALPASFSVRGRSVDVVRWEFDGSRMSPAVLARSPLG